MQNVALGGGFLFAAWTAWRSLGTG